MENNKQSVKSVLLVSSVVAMALGVLVMVGGFSGICLTYLSVSMEKITTPEDAVIPNVQVRGPLTLMSQSNIIREHMLKQAGGKTYSEMPREIAKLDADGNPVVDADGKPVMTPNVARTTWVTATALMTALHLGVLAYALSSFVVFVGFLLVMMGIMFLSIRRVL